MCIDYFRIWIAALTARFLVCKHAHTRNQITIRQLEIAETNTFMGVGGFAILSKIGCLFLQVAQWYKHWHVKMIYLFFMS